jgi:hypothetical protein
MRPLNRRDAPVRPERRIARPEAGRVVGAGAARGGQERGAEEGVPRGRVESRQSGADLEGEMIRCARAPDEREDRRR